MSDKLDKFHHHEALHTASIFMDMVARDLCEHRAVEGDTKRLKLAEKAHQALFDLYQLIGAETLGDEK